MRSTAKYFIVPVFPLSGKSNYVVEKFSAECQRAITSCPGGHSITKHMGSRGGGEGGGAGWKV